MREHNFIRLSSFALVVFAILLPGQASARIEAVKGKRYELTDRHGPWMVMVASLAGENAEPAADALVYELRRKGIPAYVFQQKAEFEDINTFDRYGRVRERKIETKDERIGVIAGNYEDINGHVAQQTLKYIKNLYPKSIGGGVYYATPGKPLPFSGAFLTINPKLSPEQVARAKRDPLILKLNTGVEHSLLDNPGQYSLIVKSFFGNSVTQIGSKFDQAAANFKVSDSLDHAYVDAYLLTKKLRQRGIDAWVYHDRYRSVVTVGSFDKEEDPEIGHYFEQFRAKEVINTNGIPEPRLQEEILEEPTRGRNAVKKIFYEPTPRLMEVPH